MLHNPFSKQKRPSLVKQKRKFSSKSFDRKSSSESMTMSTIGAEDQSKNHFSAVDTLSAVSPLSPSGKLTAVDLLKAVGALQAK